MRPLSLSYTLGIHFRLLVRHYILAIWVRTKINFLLQFCFRGYKLLVIQSAMQLFAQLCHPLYRLEEIIVISLYSFLDKRSTLAQLLLFPYP